MVSGFHIFEVHPCDYILKSIDFERFRETLNFVTIKCENSVNMEIVEKIENPAV
jgi:DNA-binding LytR/AlgR family response regulator